jgi:chromosomal replication initiation ATPase DnaA
MITKWQLVKYPVETDLNRHALFIDGDIKDLRVVMQKLARVAVSSHKAGAPYTYAIFLNNLTHRMNETIRSAMPGICQLTSQNNPAPAPKRHDDMDFFNKLTQGLMHLQNEKTREVTDASIDAAVSQEPQSAQEADPVPFAGLGDTFQIGNITPAYAAPLEDPDKAFLKNLEGQLLKLDKERSSQESKPPKPPKEPPPQKLYEADPRKTIVPPAPQEQQEEDLAPAPEPVREDARRQTDPKKTDSGRAKTAGAAAPLEDIPLDTPQTQQSSSDELVQAMAKSTDPKPAQPEETPAAEPAVAAQPEPEQPKEEAKPEPAAHKPEEAKPEPAAPQRAIMFDFKSRRNFRWDISVPINPLFTMDRITTGAHNRAVHAKTSSLMDNPGSFFNPYHIYGAPGSGKTHFLTAIYYGLCKTLGQESVLFTNGMRFSKAVRRACAEGGWSALDDELSRYQAIVIDDLNLLTVDAANRDSLAQALNSFPGNRRQMVTASVLSKRVLNDMEVGWGMRLPGGYEGQITQMAVLEAHDMTTRRVEESGIPFSVTEMETLAAGDTPLYTGGAALDRMLKLRQILGHAFPDDTAKVMEFFVMPPGHYDELPMQDDIDEAEKFVPPQDNHWGRWAVYYPEGEKKVMQYMLKRLYMRAQELKIPGWFEPVVTKAYGSPNAFTLPVDMADFCDNQKVKGALVLGPMPNTDYYKVEKDFFHNIERAFEGLGMSSATISAGKMNPPQQYTQAIVDLAY